MANTTSSRRRRPHNGNRSFRPDPKKLRPLRYKTAMGLAFEGLMESLGLDHPGAPEVTVAAWEGSR